MLQGYSVLLGSQDIFRVAIGQLWTGRTAIGQLSHRGQSCNRTTLEAGATIRQLSFGGQRQNRTALEAGVAMGQLSPGGKLS